MERAENANAARSGQLREQIAQADPSESKLIAQMCARRETCARQDQGGRQKSQHETKIATVRQPEREPCRGEQGGKATGECQQSKERGRQGLVAQVGLQNDRPLGAGKKRRLQGLRKYHRGGHASVVARLEEPGEHNKRGRLQQH